MPTTERVTVTLPVELLAGIDRFERNRSRFVAEAVANELIRRKRAELQVSVNNPHPDTEAFVDGGLADWVASLPAEDAALVDLAGGTPVRWVEGQGWVESSL